MSYSYRALVGGNLYDLPSFQKATMGYEFSDVSGLQFDYPVSGINASRVDADSVIIAYWNGVEPLDSRWIIQTGSLTGDPENNMVSYTGRSLLDIFRKVVVRAAAGKPNDNIIFTGANAGGILTNLLNAAQGRGAATNITWDFTATVDSAGQAWSQVVSIEYQLGVKYLDIIRNLVEQGMIEVRFNGTTFQAFNAGTMGVDRTTQNPPVQLVTGLDYTELPQQWSTEDRAKFALGLGNQNAVVETTNTAVPDGPFGREEISTQQGGTTDVGTLTLVNNTELSRVAGKRSQYTRKVIIRPNGPVPGQDYRVSDYIYETLGSTPSRYRVRSIGIEVPDTGEIGTAALVLNDKFLEQDIVMSRKISGIIGGATNSGAGNGVPAPANTDRTIPNPVTAVTAGVAQYQTQEGTTRCILTLSWTAPTLNTDGSSIADLKDFEINWQDAAAAGTWHSETTLLNSISVSDLAPGATINFRIRARDTTTHQSGWYTGSQTMTVDTIPPPVPSAPTTFSKLGTITVNWDGKGSAGQAQPSDFAFVQVHMGSSAGFVTSSATLMTNLPAAGGYIATGLANGVTRYFKFIAYDLSGNASAVSAEVSQVVNAIVGPDILANSITANQVAAGAMTSDKFSAGSLPHNAVLDPSFEETPDFAPLGTTDLTVWSIVGASSGAGAVRSKGRVPARSGDGSAILYTNPAGNVQLLSAPFAIDPGRNFIPAMNTALISMTPNTGVTMRVYTGATPDACNNVIQCGVENMVGLSNPQNIIDFESYPLGAVTLDGNTGPDFWQSGAYGADSPASVNIVNTGAAKGAFSGTQYMEVDWQNLTGTNTYATVERHVWGLSVGRQYQFWCWVYVPTGSPDVTFGDVYGNGTSTSTSIKDQWVLMTCTIGAVAADHYVGVYTRAPAAGTKVFIDSWTDSQMLSASDYTNFVGNTVSIPNGHYYARMLLQVNSNQMATPTNPAVATATTGGTLAAATYYYKVTSNDHYGTSTPSAEVNVVTTGTTSKNTVSWDAMPGAWSYNVYRGTAAGGETLLATVFTNTYTDTGAATTAIAMPSTNTSGEPCYVLADDISLTMEGSYSSELTRAGLRLFGPDGTETAAFVSNRKNYLSVEQKGVTLAQITSDGNMVAQQMTSVNDAMVNGRPLVGLYGDSVFYGGNVSFANTDATRDYAANPYGIIETYAKGQMQWCQFHGSDFPQVISAGSELGLFEAAFDIEPGRLYSFRMSTILGTGGAAGTAMGLRVRATTDGTTPSLTSPILVYDYDEAATTNGWCSVCTPLALIAGGSATQTFLKVLPCINSSGISGNVSIYSSQSVYAIIEDLGPTKNATGTIRNIYNTGATAPAAAAKTYTKTYTNNNHRTWRSNGSYRTDTTDVVQGYGDSYNGNQRGIWTFPSWWADVSSGATVNKVEVYVAANHWWFDSGGTAQLKLHGYTSPPSGFPSTTTVGNYSWSGTGGKWITLPSSFYSGFKSGGAYRGIGIGPGATTSGSYYGRFNGGNGAASIRITYTQ